MGKTITTIHKKLIIAEFITDNRNEFESVEKIIGLSVPPEKFELIYCNSKEQLTEKVKDAEIVLCYTFTKEMFMKARRLKWIHFGSAGVDHTLFPDLLISDIIITNSKGINSAAVSEFVLGMMLHFSNLFGRAFREFYQKREWWHWKVSTSSFILEGKTLGIVGLGQIGTAIAEKAKTFGMRIIANRLHPNGIVPDCVDILFGKSELNKLLRESDFVALTLPYTKETHHLIGENELKQMKETAYFINVARGGIVDENALIAALKENRIAGAGLDVFEQEPLPSNSELFELDNVLITPHISGILNDFVNSVAKDFAINLYRYLNNEPLLNSVSKKLGY